MKKLAFIVAGLAFSSFASAATLFVQWTDPLTAGPAYTPSYSAEYRVNGGTATAITGLTTPVITQTISAVAGNTVEVRYRASNVVVPAQPIDGPYTVWYTATQAATPGAQPAPSFTVFAY